MGCSFVERSVGNLQCLELCLLCNACPRIMSVIQECDGKMWMGERRWARASEECFEPFRNYDEAGSPQQIQVLKYLVLANMLTGSEVNPFDSQETKP